MTLKTRNIYAILILFFLVVITNICSAQTTIRVGIEPEKLMTTLRAQSFGGKWLFHLFRNTASGCAEIETAEIVTGEDEAIMLIPKGLVLKSSMDKENILGYDKIIIEGGELISLQLPDLTPKIFEGKLEITHNKEFISIVNILPIEKYVVACASLDIITIEPEAIKAHLAVLNTKANYFLKNTNHPKDDFDVCDKPHCLEFNGCGGNRELIELLYPQVGKLNIYYKNKLIYPRYHVTCGGKISSALDVYGVDEPYHPAHSDIKDGKGSENCFHSPSFHWTVEFPGTSVEDYLSLEFAGGTENVYTKWEATKVDTAGRLLMIRLLGRKVKTLSGMEFFEHLHEHYGANSLKSMRFTVEELKRTVLVRGMGEGDGVGMCLYGADGLARKKATFEEIIQFYYPGTELK